MNLRSGPCLATLALLTLAACSSGAPAPSGSASTASTSTATSGSSAPAATTYRLSDLAKHNSQADCWAAIDGGVYNLTTWISRHPGGPDKIIPLCGTDATTAFANQHDSQDRPNTQLATFRVGDLVD